MKSLHKRSLGSIATLIPIIGGFYAFGIWSGIMWVTLDDFDTFKQAQAQTDARQDGIDERYQRRWDRDDYKFYYEKICSDRQELTRPELDDFEEILDRLKYEWKGCV